MNYLPHGENYDTLGGRCSMHMLFNWETHNVCIIFSWWRADGLFTLLLSCLIIMAISASYELLRSSSRKYDESIWHKEVRRRQGVNLSQSDTNNEEGVPLLGTCAHVRATKTQQLIRSIIYAFQVLIGMFIMLIFMTYNGYLMISVVVGAGVGYYFLERALGETKGAHH